jgi:hypothetical protein
VSLPLELPTGLDPGRYSILLASAEAITAEDQRTARDGLVPQNLSQLTRRLNELRHDNRLYARLVRAAPGSLVGGERMPSLPSSMINVLSTADQGSPVVPLQSAVAWEGEATLDMAIDGARSINIVVEH